MKRLLAVALFASLTAAVGCQQDKNKTLSEAPPPPVNGQNATADQSAPPATLNLGNQGSATGGETSTNQGTTAAAPPLPTAQPQQPAAPQPTAQPQTTNGHYTVRKGDTLWSIAKRMLGDGQKWQEIVAANPGLNPKKLRVGQTIVIPQ